MVLIFHELLIFSHDLSHQVFSCLVQPDLLRCICAYDVRLIRSATIIISIFVNNLNYRFTSILQIIIYVHSSFLNQVVLQKDWMQIFISSNLWLCFVSFLFIEVQIALIHYIWFRPCMWFQKWNVCSFKLVAADGDWWHIVFSLICYHNFTSSLFLFKFWVS